MNSKGLSGIVTVVIMIALVLGVAAVVWTMVSNMVNDRLESSSSCSGVFDKVTINGKYTCYNNSKKELSFSISQGDIELEGVLVSFSGEGISKSLELPADNDNLRAYPAGSYTAGTLEIPGNNSGKTYIMNWSEFGFIESPEEVRISPIINGNQCEVSDIIKDIENCVLLIN